ncbi:MAG: 50S ribosomal protein L6 [Fusobacteriota bacterium]
MSRIGVRPIEVPEGVNVTVDAMNNVTVKGKKGTLKDKFSADIEINQENNELLVTTKVNTKKANMLHGTTRALLANMVNGVTDGFHKNLELRGVGYRVKTKGKGLELSLGFSHPVIIDPVDGIDFTVEGNNKITVSGIDKGLVGQVAANIREHRPPEPYQGKGVRYEGEYVIRKEGKQA